METFGTTTKNSRSGFFLSKAQIFVAVLAVIIIIVAEGLIIGLVARPNCEIEEELKSTTTESSLSTNQTTVDPNEGLPWKSFRLPLDLKPIEYEISLRPDLKPDSTGKFWFYGSSSVTFSCEVETKYVIIHLKKLELDGTTPLKLEDEDGNAVSIEKYFLEEETTYLVVETIEPCTKGNIYKLTTDNFKGELADDLDGFYRSKYTSVSGETRYLATSHMQTVGARKSFPCFDEPGFKANFSIILWYVKGSGYFAISNMNGTETKEETIDGVVWEGQVFDESVPMSTYLLALVVCDFKYEESFTKDGVQTRIYARPQAIDNGEAAFAKQITPLILDFFANYFGVPYPLKKSDQMGVPDFAAGAMENWGLVMYRESLMLYDPLKSSINDKLKTLSIISHELVHQWFGNIVTPVWWDNLWLNEGFASYVSLLGETAVRDDWESKSRFLVDEMRYALVVDSFTTSHPLSTTVNTQAEIQAQFDSISYNKGACVIRMVNDFLGDATFVTGLSNYLKALAYQTTTYNDLFSYWSQQAVDDNIQLPAVGMEKIMETWTLQMGYPVIHCIKSSGVYKITQEYFLLDPNAVPVQTEGSLEHGYKWYVPFTYKSSASFSGGKTTLWLEPDKEASITESDYILANVDARGYYRVNYDAETWKKLSDKLLSTGYQELSQENRAQLMDDAFNLARATKLDTVIALDLTKYLTKETKYVPWKIFTDNIDYFEYMLGRSPAYGLFEKYMQQLVVPSIYNKYAWNENNTSDEYQIQRMTSQIAVSVACGYGHKKCVEKASELYKQWMNDPTNSSIISPTYRTTILCTAIRDGGEEEWEFAWMMRSNSTNNQEERALAYGMSCSKIPWILNRYLGYCLDDTNVRKQNVISTINFIAGHEYGRDIAWSFMLDNWEYLTETFGNGWSYDRIVLESTKRFSTENELQKLQDFKVSTDNFGTAERAVEQAVEETQINIAWRKRNEDAIMNWLKNFVA